MSKKSQVLSQLYICTYIGALEGDRGDIDFFDKGDIDFCY